MKAPPDQVHPDIDALRAHLSKLRLPFMLENHQVLAQTAADKHWSHLDYLLELLSGEFTALEDRRVQRCIKLARFPVLKTLDQFDWNWPTKINLLLIQNLFHLDFVKQRANVVHRALRGPDVSFILVTSPAPMSVREVLYFAERLDQSAMSAGALVVNRVHLAPAGGSPCEVGEAAEAIAARALRLDDDAAGRVATAHHDAFKLAALDASHLRVLASVNPGVPVIRIAARSGDVHDVTQLAGLGDALVHGGD